MKCRREKETSDSCDSSLYPNLPRVAVGAVVFKEDRVLLVQRGKPPAESLWAIPGGRVELGDLDEIHSARGRLPLDPGRAWLFGWMLVVEG